MLTDNGNQATWKKIITRVVKKLKKILPSYSLFLTLIDVFIPKREDYWLFSVYFIGKGDFTDSSLAVFERVKKDSNIKKIILTRDIDIKLEGENIIIIPMDSFIASWYLMRSKIIFIQHSVWLDLAKTKYQLLFPFRRKIINLWHGIAIKDISHENTAIINKRSLAEMSHYNVITSSEIDKNNMQKAFFKTNEKDFWITGLPRNDFLIMDEKDLPASYLQDLKVLRSLVGNRNLILYAPTYRETNVNGSYYEFSEQELDVLEKYLIDNNCVLGLRYHIYRKPDCHKRILQRENILDLSAEIISDVRLIIRESSLVVTDYSSLYVDALYIEKRCVSFAYDYEHYLNTQRGFFYNFEDIFPGEICEDFDSLMQVLSNFNQEFSSQERKNIKEIQHKLFQYLDNNNSQRVIDKIISK